MRLVLIITGLLASFAGQSGQLRLTDSVLERIHKDRHAVFLVCRATKAKTNLITRTFNSRDSTITHVAIGIIRNGKFKIYSVEDRVTPATALRVGSLQNFLQPADIIAFSLWKALVSGRERRKIKKGLKSYNRKQVVFDYSFKIGNGDSLYCSEFCVLILQEAGIERFSFLPRKIEITGLYEAFLKRKQLVYYPVDFFQETTVFTRLIEKKL